MFASLAAPEVAGGKIKLDYIADCLFMDSAVKQRIKIYLK